MISVEQLTELAFKNMGRRKAHAERERGYIFYHCQRTAKLAINLRKQLMPEDDSLDFVLYAGGLFHDVAKGIEPHNERGAVLVREILKGFVQDEQLEQIAELVRKHNKRKGPMPDAEHVMLLQDADILDHFGTQEVWLKFMYGANHEESPLTAIEHWNSQGYRDYHEKMRSLLNYELSRQIFDEKIAFNTAFASRFAHESNGGYQ